MARTEDHAGAEARVGAGLHARAEAGSDTTDSRPTGGRPRAEAGSAIAEFVMVVGLLLIVFVGALQLALGLYVRNVVVDAAGEGARYGALAGSGPDQAVARTQDILAFSLSPTYQGNVTAGYVTRDGLNLLRVHVEAPLPIIGLLGPADVLRVDGHALVEPGGGP